MIVTLGNRPLLFLVVSSSADSHLTSILTVDG